MSKLKLGMASSHAFAVTEPTLWDQMRNNNRRAYERNYGMLPPEQPQVAVETDEDIAARYARVDGALSDLRRKLAELRPDVLVMVADDQNENFTDTNLPQFAIFVGERFIAGRLVNEGWETKSHAGLAEAILRGCVDDDIDMACIRKLPDDRLFAHAFGPVLKVVDPEARIPVVPIFVNAIHMPAPSPARCYYVGQSIRKAIEAYPGVERVAIYGSGGLSHFTAGYPWKDYEGSLGYGAICADFDHQLLAHMRSGNGQELAKLTTRDLIAKGEIELRSWIMVLGALGSAKPDVLVYEPFYRGVMGMGVAAWPANGA